MEWIQTFTHRMQSFGDLQSGTPGEFPVSIKVRVEGGCYCRSCCRAAWEMIDLELQGHKLDAHPLFRFEEHESGPEILAYVVLGVGLAKEIVSLVTAVIQARTEGRRRGDRRSDPVTLIVRRMESKDRVLEERVMTFSGDEQVTPEQIEALLSRGIQKIAPKEVKPAAKKATRKRS
jgi:hypothetical protein